MTTPIATSTIALPINPQPAATLSDAASKSDHAGASAVGAATPDATPARQETRQEMIDYFKKKVEIWEKLILEFADKQETRRNIALDLDAAQVALKNYLAGHPDEKGEIDFSAITVPLPETSSLRTGGVTTMTLKDLLAHYKDEQPELKLPDLPTTARELELYQAALQEAVDTAQLPLAKDEQIEQAAAVERRMALFNAMDRYSEKFGDVMLAMLKR